MSMRAVPTVGGRRWEFSHDGWLYQLESTNGTSYVHAYRMLASGRGGWVLYRSVPTGGQGAAFIAARIHSEITGS